MNPLGTMHGCTQHMPIHLVDNPISSWINGHFDCMVVLDEKSEDVKNHKGSSSGHYEYPVFCFSLLKFSGLDQSSWKILRRETALNCVNN